MINYALVKNLIKKSRTLSKKKSFWLKYFIPRLPSTSRVRNGY